MEPIITASLIAGGASLLSGGAQAVSTGKMNKSQREFAKEQMWRQNEINIENWNRQNTYNEGLWEKQKEYNERVWHMQNDYASPEAQMERFRAAGLNPNLIYGASNMGGTLDAAESTPGPSIPGAHGAVPAQNVPQLDLAQGIMSYMDFKTKALQQNNLEEQNKAIRAQAAFTDAQTLGALSKRSLTDLQAKYLDSATLDMLDGLKLKNRQLNQQYEMKEKYYEMDSTRMDQWIRQSQAAVQRMANQNLTDAKQRELMDMDIKLRKMGFGPGTPWYIRGMGTVLDNIKSDWEDPVKKQGMQKAFDLWWEKQKRGIGL